jgi:capsular exopolysaccharide synthesis family protein
MPEAQSADHNLASHALRIVRRRLPIILLTLVVCAGAAAAYSLSQPTKYTSTAVLLFRAPDFDQSLFPGTQPSSVNDPTRQAATNLKLVSLTAVADRAARKLGGGLTGTDLAKEVEITEQGQSDLVGIAVTDRDKRRAARIANVFAREFIGFRREADRAKINQALTLSEREFAGMPPSQQRDVQGKLLRQRINQLETLQALQTGNAELVQPATPPSSPSSPTPVKDTVIAAILGLFLGVGLAFLIDRLDRRLRDPKDVEEIVQRPVLGAVPRSRALSRGRIGTAPLPPGEAEAFRMLRANLRYFNVDRDIRSVLVTSAAPGDGKSTVSANLAFAASEAGTRTLLLEADLRHPTLARLMGLPSTPGLTNVLAAHKTLEEVLQRVPVPGRGEGHLPRRDLDVVVSGPIPPNPSDLMESDRLRQLIKAAEIEYDLVIVDTPPTSVVSDAIPLVNQTNGVIVVARLGTTKREALTHLRDQLNNLDAPMLGVVVNSLGRDSTSYGGYGAGYGYYGTPTPDESLTNGHVPPVDVTLEPGSSANGTPVSDIVPEQELAAAAGTPQQPPAPREGGADAGPGARAASTWETRPAGGATGGSGDRRGGLAGRLRGRPRNR